MYVLTKTLATRARKISTVSAHIYDIKSSCAEGLSC